MYGRATRWITDQISRMPPAALILKVSLADI